MALIVPLYEAHVSLDALAVGLPDYVRASGLLLPEDEGLLDRIVSAARFGSVEAVLAVQADQAVGIAAWQDTDGIGHINLLYVLPGQPETVTRALLAHMMAQFRAGDAVNVYAEFPAVPPPMGDALAESGFVGIRRLLMQADLTGPARFDAPADAIPPPGYLLEPWDDAYLEAAAQIVYRANMGTTDALIIPELRTPDSTRAVLHQTLAGRYGRFDRAASGLIFHHDGQAVGVTLTTQRSGGQGFVAEICVLAGHRRRGLARALMQHTHTVFRAAGLRESTLGVTAGNPAQHLYERLGYAIIGSIWSYVWPKPPGWALADLSAG